MEEIEQKIHVEIDAAFDDEMFLKGDPDFRVDAACASKEFGNKKTDLVDYMLWSLKFVPHSDMVEW